MELPHWGETCDGRGKRGVGQDDGVVHHLGPSIGEVLTNPSLSSKSSLAGLLSLSVEGQEEESLGLQAVSHHSEVVWVRVTVYLLPHLAL